MCHITHIRPPHVKRENTPGPDFRRFQLLYMTNHTGDSTPWKSQPEFIVLWKIVFPAVVADDKMPEFADINLPVSIQE